MEEGGITKRKFSLISSGLLFALCAWNLLFTKQRFMPAFQAALGTAYLYQALNSEEDDAEPEGIENL